MRNKTRSSSASTTCR
jgi:hypothetical protein